MIFTEETWELVGAGFVVCDCVFRKPDRQAFVLTEQIHDDTDTLPRTRILFTYNDEEDPFERYYFVEFGDFQGTRIAGTDEPQFICAVDISNGVYAYDAELDEREVHPHTLHDTELVSVPHQIARIGKHLYTVGTPRRLHRRVGRNQWDDLTKTLPIPQDYIDEDIDALMSKYNWKGVCGFSETDIYAVGGIGDVWHFNGKVWTQCKFDDECQLESVCCAGDGQVYVGGSRGELWVGRKDEWTSIAKNETASPWLDLAWFQDRLLLGEESDLVELKDGKLVPFKLPKHADRRCAGRLDVSPDGNYLLTSGAAGAMMFDGSEWETLFNHWKL